MHTATYVIQRLFQSTCWSCSSVRLLLLLLLPPLHALWQVTTSTVDTSAFVVCTALNTLGQRTVETVVGAAVFSDLRVRDKVQRWRQWSCGSHAGADAALSLIAPAPAPLTECRVT